jgi:saccharopine dehydrogenase-like NADP-dependent oxidoreductase
MDFLKVENENDITKSLALTAPDIVISSLPYHQTKAVAKQCILHSHIPYCDLGGRVDVSDKINQWGTSTPVFTDLGLAPGWVNILAEHGCDELLKTGSQASEVKMMVGGIPEAPDNPLNYSVTWSIDGLINEYRDSCVILENGSHVPKKGMTGLEQVFSKALNKNLEAFYTSGGASHSSQSMLERGVLDCSYKTLRYQGHCDIVEFLIRKCALSDECLTSVFQGCASKGSKDIVLIKVSIKSKSGENWEKEMLIRQNPSTCPYSAMQKATGFSLASVAKEMVSGGSLDKPRQLSYRDVNYEKFTENMDLLREKVGDAPYEQA